MLADRIKSGEIKRRDPDSAEAEAYYKSAVGRLKFIKKAALTEDDAPYIFVDYYEALRTLCDALMSWSGFKAQSHSAIPDYLQHIGQKKAARVFDQSRQIRNRINYYGKSLSKSEAIKRIADIISVFEVLKKVASKKLKL